MITPHSSITASDSIGYANGNQYQYVPSGTGPAYWGPGDQVTFLITGEQTGGAFFMAEVSVPPGGGTPPHIHRREEETFYVQQGTLTIQVGDKTLHAAPGDLVYLPRGIMHCFKNAGNVDAKFLVVVTPAGLDKFFEEAFYPLRNIPHRRRSLKRCWVGFLKLPPGTAWSFLCRHCSKC